MTTDHPDTPRPSASAARSRFVEIGLPALISALVHLSVAFAAGLFVWRVVTPAQAPARQVTVHLDAPAPAPVRNTQAQRTESVSPLAAGALAPAPAARAPRPTFAPAPALGPQQHDAPLLDALTQDAAAQGTGSQAIDASLFQAQQGSKAPIVFAGLGASDARSIVYVIDGSGPMVISLPFVISEVQRSIQALDATQRFTVIVFRRTTDDTETDDGVESFTAIPVRATARAKRELASWLATIKPAGRSVPLDGLRAAISKKPDAIFLLSHSINRSAGGRWGKGANEIMAELDTLNPPSKGPGSRRHITIQTVQFLTDDPTGLLQRIAADHAHQRRGYRVIRSVDELGRSAP